MIITCPKYQYYSAMSEVVKSSMRAKMKQVISEYVKVKPTIFLEDTLAKALLGDSSNIVSITDPRDYSQMMAFGYYDAESYMPGYYTMYENRVCKFVKFENPVMAKFKNDLGSYMDKRVEAYEKRLLSSVYYMAAESKAILRFCGSVVSRSKLDIKPKENDGILNLMFDLERDLMTCYYSGNWIDVEIAKQLLGGLYG